MKKQNKSPFILFLSVFIIISALSISAYTGLFKSDPTKVKQTISPPKETSGGGPIQFQSSLDNNYYFDNNSVYLYIDLKADKVREDRLRTPLNIAIVIDKSGSMAEKNKLEYVKKAVDYIIDQVDRDDYISVIAYDDYVNIVQRSGILRDKYDLRDKVSRIKPDGFTNLSEGMFEGYAQVNGSYSRGYVNRVLLLSDGLANRGVTDRYKLADIVRDKNRRDGVA